MQHNGVFKRKIDVLCQQRSYWRDTVTDAGFIKDQRIAKNDYVTVVSTSDHKRTEYYVSAVTNGAATLVAVPADA